MMEAAPKAAPEEAAMGRRAEQVATLVAFYAQ
eukprot:COSAG04_NODE_27426_length_283_cov_0.836957_1_plen_31_part_01